MPFVGYIIAAIVAYLLGSIPTGFLVAKARGLDIRAVGSGNIGATNVFRQLGTGAGVLVLLADGLKGWVAVEVTAKLLWTWFHASDDWRPWVAIRIVAGLAAILGHNYTCWLRFKGGKGIATSAGVLAALVPLPLLIITSVWIVVFALTRYVSLASVLASFTLPFATWFTRHDLTQHDLTQGPRSTLTIITGIMAALAIYKHKSNIKRLLKGTEHRIGGKKVATAETPRPGS
jgi:acyl phosphate:glycerol-3-phosphate acyltransferase